MRIKWEPLALMVLVLALAVWLVAGRGGLRNDPRVSPHAWAVHDIKIGNTRGVIELFPIPTDSRPAIDGVPQKPSQQQTCRMLFRDGYQSPRLTFEQVKGQYGEAVARDIFSWRSNVLFRLFNITSWGSFLWVGLGIAGQLAFSGRTMLQWLVSEHKGKSTVPAAYWWLSLVGGALLFAYFVWRQDLVGVLGQSSGLVVYGRNLRLLAKERALGAHPPRDSGSVATGAR